MPNKITNNLRVRQAELLKQAMSSNTDPHFVFLARHRSYAGGDSTAPDVNLSLDGSLYDIYRNMMCGKLVTENDIAFLIKNVEWKQNTVYSFYDDKDPDLFSKEFFVTVKRGTARDVFLCVGNNGGGVSTVAPSLTDTTAYEFAGYQTLPDRYVWKYMFTVPQVEYTKFNTNGMIPVIPNANVSGNAVSGSIDYVTVTKGGSGYSSFSNGYFQQVIVDGNVLLLGIDGVVSSTNAHFYDGCAIKIVEGRGQGQIRTINTYAVAGSARRVLVDTPFDPQPNTSSRYEITPAVVLVGDGSGFLGRALVNTSASNTISYIEISDHGKNYTWAEATVVGNTGGLSNTAAVRPIIGPYGGHGVNTAAELGSNSLCISVKFNSTEAAGKVLDTNEFRTVGVLRDPLFANVSIILDTAADFIEGDTVVQETTRATGKVVSSLGTSVLTLTNVLGYFRSGYRITGKTAPYASATAVTINGQETYFNQTTKLNVALETGPFTDDEQITQLQSNGTTANAYVYAHDTVNHQLWLTDPRGIFLNLDNSPAGSNVSVVGDTSGVTAIAGDTTPGDLVVGSGEVLYIDNKTPVSKNAGQTETVKITIEF